MYDINTPSRCSVEDTAERMRGSDESLINACFGSRYIPKFEWFFSENSYVCMGLYYQGGSMIKRAIMERG